jgi:hypothetical protein
MATVSHGEKTSPVIGEKITEARLAQSHRPFEHGVEYGPEIAGRRVDDAKHLGHGGLSGERLIKLGSEISSGLSAGC